MNKIRKKKILLDIAILAASCVWVFAVWFYQMPEIVIRVSVAAALIIGIAALCDWVRNAGRREHDQVFSEQAATEFAAYELVLLNEHDKPVRAWDLTGKTAMVIGRKSKQEDVDVDLSDCEYSALVNIHHAVLNFSLDAWYVEDLGSQNGIRITKAEDGVCYRVTANRPCKLSAGDVIYIAKTKLLFT